MPVIKLPKGSQSLFIRPEIVALIDKSKVDIISDRDGFYGVVPLILITGERLNIVLSKCEKRTEAEDLVAKVITDIERAILDDSTRTSAAERC